MTRTIKFSLLSGILGLAAFALPSIAHAKKPGVLEGKPIVVKQKLLRKRFHVTPVVGMSLSQPFVHKGTVGIKLGYNFIEQVGVRGTFQYGVVDVESRLLRALNGGGLPEAEDGANGPVRPITEVDNPAPLKNDFQAGLTKLQLQASVDAVFTPFAGKLGLFQAIFTEYDIYIFGGLGITQWTRMYPDATATSEAYGLETSQSAYDQELENPGSSGYCRSGQQITDGTTECLLRPVSAQDGIRLGGSFGAGIHLFITDWVAINAEVQDILITHNIGGLNSTVAETIPTVDGNDRAFVHNVNLQLGATFYFPFRPKRSKLRP